jgi:L-iditol 2-dehydrogenase
MKAAFLTAEKTFEIRDIPDPTTPEDGLVMKVEFCGVCGGDVRRWKEGKSHGLDNVILGHEITGVVESVGKFVSIYKPGIRLAIAPDIHCGTCYYCQRALFNLCDHLKLIGISPEYPGGFAEKIVLTGEVLRNGIVNYIPQNLPLLDAALSEPCSSVLATHDKLGTSLGDIVVIMGAGPMGCLLLAIAKLRGALVIISEPVAERREMIKAFGPELVIDPASQDLNKIVREMTAGIGADIVICANPVATTQTQAVEVVRKSGKVVFFGGLPKSAPNTTVDANRIHYGEIELLGSFSYHPRFHKLALDVLAQGMLPVERIITHKFPLTEINQAFSTAERGDAIKVVIMPA